MANEQVESFKEAIAAALEARKEFRTYDGLINKYNARIIEAMDSSDEIALEDALGLLEEKRQETDVNLVTLSIQELEGLLAPAEGSVRYSVHRAFKDAEEIRLHKAISIVRLKEANDKVKRALARTDWSLDTSPDEEQYLDPESLTWECDSGWDDVGRNLIYLSRLYPQVQELITDDMFLNVETESDIINVFRKSIALLEPFEQLGIWSKIKSMFARLWDSIKAFFGLEIDQSSKDDQVASSILVSGPGPNAVFVSQEGKGSVPHAYKVVRGAC